MAVTDAGSLSLAAFTALGTIVGYLGTEVASGAVFNRLLWPSRFYNRAARPGPLVSAALLMPMGGPIHKAAVETLDQFVLSGLWKGYCRGDMLGSAFYGDMERCYVVRGVNGSKGERKTARNAFWLRVLDLIQPPQLDAATTANDTTLADDGSAERTVLKLRARRPVFVLKLSRAPAATGGTAVPVVDGDVGPQKLHHFAGVVASEAITLIVGVVTAAIWQSPFSAWYIVPLLLKLIAFACRVRRTSIEPPSSKGPTDMPPQPPATEERVLCESEDFSKGFSIIEGPSELVLQFFRHYGHPIRSRRVLLGDRVREVISMLTVVAFILVYPAGLLAFIFAPINIQWAWLGYQIYAMLAMHLFRFGGGRHIGTTEEWVARELSNHKTVCLDFKNGNKVIAELEYTIVWSAAEGRDEVERQVQRIWAGHPENVNEGEAGRG